MNTIYFLSTCSTCQKIIKSIPNIKSFTVKDIKTEKITAKEIDDMKTLAGSYEALFSKRAIKYKTLGLKDKMLEEKDYRKFILEEYTFLKRPVIIFNNKIFIGNEKTTLKKLETESGAS